MTEAPIEAFTQRLKLIAQATSAEAAAKLVETFPGKRIYIPIEIDESHELSRTIGIEQAERLSNRYGGFYVELPTGVAMRNFTRDKQIVDEYYNQGRSTLELGRKYSLSPRQIMRIVKGQGDTEESAA